MSEIELMVGRVYPAKKPSSIYLGLTPYYNDRQILWIGLTEVQYDSPAVKTGQRYKTVSKEAFLKWVGRDVTDEMPKGDWAEVKKVA
jgi:hypothetical protein